MKTIASLKGPDFLRACNKARHAVEDYLKKTQILDLRKILPEVPDGATAEETEAALEKQGRANLSAMLDRALEDYPEETYILLQTLCIPEAGEELDGYDLIAAGLELLTTPKVTDFFFSLAKSVQTTMGA